MKRYLTLILVVLPLLIFGQANKLFRQALRTEDLKERIELLNQVISLESDKLDAYFYRAIARNSLGDYSGAIIDYSKIILKEPDADSYFNRGNARYSLEDFEGAKADYEDAIKIDSNFLDAIYSLGCANYDLGNYNEAISVFNQLLSKEAYYANAYTLRAMSYANLENYKQASKDYTVAVFIDPSADNYYNRGVFLLGINYYQKAKNDFTTAIRLNRNNGYAYFYRGTTHVLLGKYKNAISDFEKALSFDDLDFDAMLGLSMTYYKLKDAPMAKAYFDKAKNVLQSNGNAALGIALFENTFWYKNQFYFFKEAFNELETL